MMYAEKGNKVIQVGEQDVQRYMSLGFVITDGKGTVLKDTVPTDIGTLQQAYTKHTNEIADLKKQIADLQAELSAKTKVSDNVIETAPKEVTEEKAVSQKSRGRKPQKAEE